MPIVIKSAFSLGDFKIRSLPQIENRPIGFFYRRISGGVHTHDMLKVENAEVTVDRQAGIPDCTFP
jgi:hypothetical protein